MLDRLEAVDRRFDEINARLSSGQADAREMTTLLKEQAQLRELVETYRTLRKIKNELAEAQRLLESENDSEMRQLAKTEIQNLEQQLPHLEQHLKILLLPKDANDDKNTLLEIRAGTGGEEAALFVANLLRMYLKYSEKMGWRTEILSENSTDKGGLKEVVVLVSGNKVFSHLKFEGGIHRVQRVPETEASGRIHTSAATVAVLPEAEDVDVNIPEHEIRIDVFRAGGHGGQSVNTTDSAVRLTHIPSGLVVICQDEKSQHKNKAKALKVLRARLLDMKLSEQKDAEASARKGMVGSGDRSEKIRTYNFPQSRVTDHRIGLTLHALEDVLNGNLHPLVDALILQHQAELMKSGGA